MALPVQRLLLRRPRQQLAGAGNGLSHGRRAQVPIDTVVFEFHCMPEGVYTKPPEDGAYITGMFLEGARWDYGTMELAESEPKVLHTPCPVIWCAPGAPARPARGPLP